MKLAIYDFDGTYIDTQTLPFLYELWRKLHLNDQAVKKIWGKIMRRYLLHKLHIFGWGKANFRANAMELTADLFHSVERPVLDAFLEDFYQAIKPHVNQKMHEQLREDNLAGYHTVLLSGNFDIILKPFLKEGFAAVIGTDIETHLGLKSSKEVKIIINQEKQDIIRKHYPDADFSASKAYADSDYDLPIFELVGHPVAVNPDKLLRVIANERKFEIIDTE